ncbi:MAG: NAD-binding protein [Verrucomicrobiota bacterium]
MSLHSSQSASSHEAVHHRSWEWWLITFLAFSAAGFGSFGHWRYDMAVHKHADPWSVGYHTLQLFLLHSPHLEADIPWSLHAGRWLAAAVVLTAVTKGLTRVFRSEWRLISTRFRGEHVVICGLGRLGLQLAREFRRHAKTGVIALDLAPSPTHFQAAESAGVAVVSTETVGAAEWRRVGLPKAKQVVLVCDDEQTNVALATEIGALLRSSDFRKGSREPLECWLFLPDPRLRHLFRQDSVFPQNTPRFRINVRGLDLFELAARQALASSPLDFQPIRPDDATTVHLVIVGCGALGQQLALQAARIGHFANLRKLRLTLVDWPSSPRPAEFRNLYPAIDEICDVTTMALAVDEPAAITALSALGQNPGKPKELTTFALCWDRETDSATRESDMFEQLERDDGTNLALTLELADALRQDDVRFLSLQTRACGFGAIYRAQDRGSRLGPRVHAFGMLEHVCTMDTLLHETQDAIAKALHQDYLEHQSKAAVGRPGHKPGLVSWAQLSERLKDSNRQAADHIPVKLRAISYRLDQRRNDQPSLLALDDEAERDPDGYVELLARMEHLRWRADMLLQHFELGPRNDPDRKHDCLKLWEELPAETKELDRQQVRAIPRALQNAGYGIYPLAS